MQIDDCAKFKAAFKHKKVSSVIAPGKTQSDQCVLDLTLNQCDYIGLLKTD